MPMFNSILTRKSFTNTASIAAFLAAIVLGVPAVAAAQAGGRSGGAGRGSGSTGSTGSGGSAGRGTTGRGAAARTPEARPALGAAWGMPDHEDLVERVIRRVVSQDRPGAVPMAEYTFRAIGKQATLAAVRQYLGRDVELPASVFASVADWTDARDRLPVPECAAADSTCVQASSVWLAVTKFERGDLPHELNVWYTTSFAAKPHDQVITSRYSFCERWLRVGGTWKYDGFIRVTSG